MFKRIMPLLNIKPAEASLVKHLFIIQFLLGIATAFLSISSLTLFLSSFSVKDFPKVLILSALLILFSNKVYAYFEKKYSSSELLYQVILFSLASTSLFWVFILVFDSTWLKLVLIAWNALIYMLVGYAFWGVSALLFNVRESKRVFSIVGSGDIPAKILGYSLVYLLVYQIGPLNLLWVTMIAFLAALAFIKKLDKQIQASSTHITHLKDHHSAQHKYHLSFTDVLERLFQSKLVFFISLSSFIAYIIFSFVDFTFLAEIKVKYKNEKQLASFITIFFAVGRIFAIIIKLLFSSRMIARIGLMNSLLITPILLLLINSVVLFFGDSLNSLLYIFGTMVILIEVLRSAVQEPVFFILFQPLNPHDRLKGHLIAKGYTLPIALLGVGIFLIFYQQSHNAISILYISKLIIIFLLLWISIVVLIKHEYLQTLINSIKKGYFTGSELFLNDTSVFNLLIEKTKSQKPLEVIHALNLLERSGYLDIFKILLDFLRHNNNYQVREYILERVISNNMTSALPIIKKLVNQGDATQAPLYKALYFLEDEAEKTSLDSLNRENKTAALTGLLLKKDTQEKSLVKNELLLLATSSNVDDNKLAIEVITAAGEGSFTEILQVLLQNSSASIYQKAIEIAGKVKDFSLFNDVLTVAQERNAYFSLERALVNYGDPIFDESYLPDKSPSEKLFSHIIKAASKVKGDKSDKYLLNLLGKGEKDQDCIIEAMWQKKASLLQNSKLIEEWIIGKLENMKTKVNCFLNLHHNKQAYLLESALISEIEQNVETVLKAFALIYEKDQIQRFIEVYKLDNPSKVANAMELLELTLPRKYFVSLIYFIELSQDLKKEQVILQDNKVISAAGIVKEVITNSNAHFNTWSRSVALYLLPKLYSKDLAIDLATYTQKEEDILVKETRDYVLSVLK
ncbi:MAG: hypothetical protein ABR502_02020 [Chitinophagaceae bacterium]